MFAITNTSSTVNYNHGDSVNQTVSVPAGTQGISGTFRVDYSSDGGSTWTEQFVIERGFLGVLATDLSGYRVTGSIPGADPSGLYRVTAVVIYMQIS